MLSVTLRVFSLLLILIASIQITIAQTNLLKNPDAYEGNAHWRKYGDASVDESKKQFTVQNSGHLYQDVPIPPDSVNKFVVLFGRGASKQIAEDGSGRPLISGVFMIGNWYGGRGYDILNEQKAVSNSTKADELVNVLAIYRIPLGPKFIRFFLTQTAHKTSRENVSPVYFDKAGVYIFDTATQAKRFAETFTPKIIYGNSSYKYETKPCTINRNELPNLYGFKFGMTEKEILSLFPESKIEKSHVYFGTTSLTITQIPIKENGRFNALHKIAFGLIDDLVYHVYVELKESPWRNVDEFIESYTEREKLPSFNAWDSSLFQWSKYTICDEVEINFRLYRYNTPSFISFMDRNAEAIFHYRIAKGLSWREESQQ